MILWLIHQHQQRRLSQKLPQHLVSIDYIDSHKKRKTYKHMIYFINFLKAFQNSSTSSGDPKSIVSSSTSEDLHKPIHDSNDSSIYYVPKVAKKRVSVFPTHSQILSSTPFVNSQNQEDNSFHSLQLSGNLTNTPTTGSNPELTSVLQSPSKLIFQSSSSDEEKQKMLNANLKPKVYIFLKKKKKNN